MYVLISGTFTLLLRVFQTDNIRPQISAFCPKEEQRTSSSGTRTKQTMRDYRQANFVQDPYFTGKKVTFPLLYYPYLICNPLYYGVLQRCFILEFDLPV